MKNVPISPISELYCAEQLVEQRERVIELVFGDHERRGEQDEVATDRERHVPCQRLLDEIPQRRG